MKGEPQYTPQPGGTSTPSGYEPMPPSEQGPLLDASKTNPMAMTMTGETKPGSASRVFYLRIIDSRKWHYTEAFALLVDFVLQTLAVAFLPKSYYVPVATGLNPTEERFFADMDAAIYARYASSGCMVFYLVALLLRICGLRSAVLRSRSNMADVVVILLLGAALGARYYPQLKPHEFDVSLGYLCLLALRLVLKPRARTFSKKLHKFRANGDHIRISIESLRASLARIPDISALAIEKMETDLLMICGRDAGDMTRQELMSFLERALRYRPHTLSATDFLAHLRDIDASSSQVVYSVFDVVRSTFGHWSNQLVDLTLCFLVVCVNAAVSPAMAYFLARLSEAFTTIWRNSPDEDVFNIGVLGLLGLSVPFVLSDYAIGYFQSKMIAKATQHMQNSILSIVLRQDSGFFADRSEGDLNNVFASDVARVNALWQAVFWNLLNPVISVGFGFAYAIYMKYPIGVMAIAFTLMLMTSGPQGLAGSKSKQFAMKNAYVAADFQNAVGCEKVIRAYKVQNTVVDKFKKSCLALRKAQFSKDFWSSLVQIYIESAMFIFTVVMSASLAMKVWNATKYPEDAILVGDFFGFMVLLQRVSNPVATLGGFMRVAINNAGSLQRVDDIIIGLGQGTKHDQDTDRNLPGLSKMQKDLRLEKLFFKYDKGSDRYVLADLTATIPRGSFTCIVGPSGCGKSTLLACLMQFQQVDGGAIRLDGHDIFNFSKTSFMDQTAVVFQDGGILNGTIYDNIRYGNTSASNKECEEAALAAECHFIRDLKDGYETVVGQHAITGLSGGQAQRLCLARALCRKPTLLLLDEATSALDPETEASIVSTLEKLASKMNMTIISVTHRLATTINADQILVMNQGRVAEEGRYDNLLRLGGLFTDMINHTNDSDDDAGAGVGVGAQTPQQQMLKKPATARSTSVGRHQSIDTIGESGNSALALQQFTRTLSSRVAANRSRQNTEDRRSGNLSLLSDNQWPEFQQGRGAAMSAASQTSEDERSKYFVL